VALLVKKDGSRRFCGDYRPLNAHIGQDSFPMLLIDDVLDQLGEYAWFTTLGLRSRFCQISMALEDMKKTTVIIKSSLYEWNVMPFELKNVANIFLRIVVEGLEKLVPQGFY